MVMGLSDLVSSGFTSECVAIGSIVAMADDFLSDEWEVAKVCLPTSGRGDNSSVTDHLVMRGTASLANQVIRGTRSNLSSTSVNSLYF